MMRVCVHKHLNSVCVYGGGGWADSNQSLGLNSYCFKILGDRKALSLVETLLCNFSHYCAELLIFFSLPFMINGSFSLTLLSVRIQFPIFTLPTFAIRR